MKKAVKKERITDLEAIILAGMFARTNSGCDMPTPRDVEYARNMRYPNVDSSVTIFVRDICETDEMLAGFVEEGKMWYKDLKKMSRAEIEKTWPKHGKLFWT